MQNSNLLPDFNTFKEPVLERMKYEAGLICHAMKIAPATNPYWLVMTGASGTGKTMVAKAIYHWFKQSLWNTPDEHNRSRLGGFCDWTKCVDKLKEGRYGLVDGIIEDWLAVIDDVGAEHDPSKFGATNLMKILNGREKKWTVITSNLMLDEIGEKLDVRIASRLIRNKPVLIDVNCIDYNLR